MGQWPISECLQDAGDTQQRFTWLVVKNTSDVYSNSERKGQNIVAVLRYWRAAFWKQNQVGLYDKRIKIVCQIIEKECITFTSLFRMMKVEHTHGFPALANASVTLSSALWVIHHC